MSFFIITNAITSYFIARDIKTDIIEIYGQFSDFVQDSSVKMAYLNLNSTVINADLKAELTEFLSNSLGVEEALREKLLSYKSCHISKHLLDEGALDVYYTSNNTEIQHKNAYDFIKDIKLALNLYIENPKNQENIDFLLNTTMIIALPKIEKYLYDIIGCSNTSVDALNTINYVIVVVQVSLLIASFLLKFSEVIKILQNFNRIWTTIGENVHKYYYQIRDRCINRLTENLNIKEEEIFHLYDLTAVKIPKFSITPKQIFGQMWIVILFIAVSFVYFLVVSQISYIKIGENIKNANNFNYLLYKHKGYLSQIDFWTVAGLSNYTSKGIQKEKLLKLWEKFSKNVKAIENESCFIHVDNGIYDSLYKKNSQNLIKNGAIHESEVAYYDSFYISENNDLLEIDMYRRKMQDLRSVVETNIEDTYAYGKKIAMDEIRQIIVWSVLYTVFAFSMFFFVYLPFLNRQRVYFKHIEILAKIFVN